jgi:flagellar hook-associated protein FlgK
MTKRRLSIITSLALALTVIVAGGCGKGGSGSLSPTDTLKAYYDAASKKDVAGLKKYLSKGTMNMMEVGAKNMGKSVDDALKESAANEKQTATPKFANEKITGDTATVDITAEGQTIAMPLVKEGGEWKIAMDKLLENMGAPKVPTSTSTTTTAPPTAPPAASPADDDEDHENSNH